MNEYAKYSVEPHPLSIVSELYPEMRESGRRRSGYGHVRRCEAGDPEPACARVSIPTGQTLTQWTAARGYEQVPFSHIEHMCLAHGEKHDQVGYKVSWYCSACRKPVERGWLLDNSGRCDECRP